MTQTTEQVEAVARAICAPNGRDPNGHMPGPGAAGAEAGGVPQRRAYEVQARRIIDP